MLSQLVSGFLKHTFRGKKRILSDGDVHRDSQSQDMDKLFQEAYEKILAGDYSRAETIYMGILTEYPNEPAVCHCLGRLKGQTGDYTTARSYLEKAIKIKPDFADAYSDLGNISKLEGNLEEAFKYYQKAVNLEPENLVARCNLGVTLLDLGRNAEAIVILEDTVKRAPDFLRGRVVFGQALQSIGKYDNAVEHLEYAYSFEPDNSDVLKNLVSALASNGQFDRAFKIAEQALKDNPDLADAHASMGFLLLKTDKLDEALNYLQRAADLNPVLDEVHNNMGVTLQYLGRIEEALVHYDKAIQLNPNDHQARLHRSLAYLMMGEYEKGWSEYDMRFRQRSRHTREFPYPEWDGTSLEGKTILVHAEQGLGDEIMFASCIPDLLNQGGNIILDCLPKLEAIFRRSFPEVTVHGGEQTEDIGWISEFEPIDMQIPIGGLPKIFRKDRSQFPEHDGYLGNDIHHVNQWKQRLDRMDPGVNVGISWQGGTDKTNRSRRVIELDKWLPILKQPGFNFISLQYNDCQEKLMSFREKHGILIHHWQDAIDDYEQTAALVEALDLVVSVQTAIVHLAGALGQTVWVMVPASPEWRYGYEGNTMLWYPSARLFRQQKLHEWGPVLEHVSVALKGFESKS